MYHQVFNVFYTCEVFVLQLDFLYEKEEWFPLDHDSYYYCFMFSHYFKSYIFW